MLLDVTQTIADGMPCIPVLPDVRIEQVTSIASGRPLNISQLHLATHAGTHIDAPLHAVNSGRGIDELPLETFTGSGAVVTIRRGAGEQIPLSDVLDAAVGVRRGDILLLHTGWADLFHEEDYADHPYPSVELARWCVDTGIKMLGVDCITVDQPVSRRQSGFAYPVHRTLRGNEVLIIENLASLREAADTRVEVYAFPLKVERGDAGHARVVLRAGTSA